mmetsp:Transcript_20705/g.60223  ORF Transcript_20705/g.60223 Transcript_20705/m.60223 type:complete len:263 (+) Transcript_20705:447-1235(+)
MMRPSSAPSRMASSAPVLMRLKPRSHQRSLAHRASPISAIRRILKPSLLPLKKGKEQHNALTKERTPSAPTTTSNGPCITRHSSSTVRCPLIGSPRGATTHSSRLCISCGALRMPTTTFPYIIRVDVLSLPAVTPSLSARKRARRGKIPSTSASLVTLLLLSVASSQNFLIPIEQNISLAEGTRMSPITSPLSPPDGASADSNIVVVTFPDDGSRRSAHASARPAYPHPMTATESRRGDSAGSTVLGVVTLGPVIVRLRDLG